MVFVSYTGTQMMAVINPLLSLIEAGEQISGVRLLATARTGGLAAKIRDHLISERLSVQRRYPLSRPRGGTTVFPLLF